MRSIFGIATRHRFGTTLCEIRTIRDGRRTTAMMYVVQEVSLVLQRYGGDVFLDAPTHEAARRLAIDLLEGRLGAQTVRPATVEEAAECRVIDGPRIA